MNCRRIEKLIPLFVEDDLPTKTSELVASHLEWCGRCNWLADEYNQSQGWIHSFETPDVDEAFLEDMKRTVLKRVQHANPRRTMFAALIDHWSRRQVLALATASLVVLGALVFYVYQGRVVTPSITELADTGPTESAGEPIAAISASAVPSPAQVKRRRLPRGRVHSEPRRVDSAASVIASEPQRLQQAEEPGPQQKSGAADGASDLSSETHALPVSSRDMLRIEIQTADPNIRIIWFAPREMAAPFTGPATDFDDGPEY